MGSLGVLLILMALLTPVASAHGIGAYNVKVTKDYVTSKALCSCGMGSYTHHSATFKNYCPGCHSKGTLRYEVGDYYGADYTSPEGLWFCTRCDRDYCCQCGKIHSGEGYWLYKTSIKHHEKKINNSTKIHKAPPEPTVKILDKIVKKSVLRNIHMVKPLGF